MEPNIDSGKKETKWVVLSVILVIAVLALFLCLGITAVFFLGGSGFGLENMASITKSIKTIHDEATADIDKHDYAASLKKYGEVERLIQKVGVDKVDKTMLSEIYWNIAVTHQMIADNEKGSHAVEHYKNALKYSFLGINKAGDNNAYWNAGDAELGIYHEDNDKVDALERAIAYFTKALNEKFSDEDLSAIYLSRGDARESLGDIKAASVDITTQSSVIELYESAISDYGESYALDGTYTTAGELREALEKKVQAIKSGQQSVQ